MIYPTLTALLTAYVRGDINDSILASEIDKYPSQELGAYIFAIVTRSKNHTIPTVHSRKRLKDDDD